MSIKVSVIIPIYNVEKFLPYCINSVLNQTLKDIEIILINDGSTDRSGIIAEEYCENYRQISVIHLKNGGQSIARNRGIEIAKGEFISFIDSDDYIDCNMLEVMYNKAKEYNTDVVMCGYRKVCDNKIISENKPVIVCNKRLIHSQIRELIINANKTNFYWFACRNIYRKCMLDRYSIKFSESINMGEDTLLNLNAFYNASSIIAIDQCFYNYRDNPNSLTQTKYKPNLNKIMIKHYDEKLNFYKLNNMYELAKKDIKEHICFSVLPMLLSNAYNSPYKNKIKLYKNILEIPFISNALNDTNVIMSNARRGNKIVAILSKFKSVILIKYLYNILNM